MSCVDTLGPGNSLCNSDHCNEFQETSNFHAICLCIDWQGNPIPDCNPKNSNYPVQTGQCFNPNTGAIENTTSQNCTAKGAPWYWQTCYCCCTCFAANTPIAIPTGTIAIGDVQINDSVLAAAGTEGAWTWSPQLVTFSSGAPATTSTNPTAGNMMIYMGFGDDKALILSRDQLVMLPDGKLKRADQLVPGADQLVDAADNASLPIHQLASGYYKGAVHHIATATPSYTDWDGSIDNHLINANGIIGGDYLLQMYQETDKMRPHLAAPEAPDLGSPEYHAAAPASLMVKPFVVGKKMMAAGVEVTAPGFRAHAASEALIPSGAVQLFTARQEALLMGPTIPKRGFSDVTNVQLTHYYAKLYGAFYPGIDIYLDWESIHPNVYAFKQYGTQVVVIGGELLRLGPLYGPAMAMAISFGVANGALEGNADDVGHSLYDGIGVIMQQVFQGGGTIGELQQGGQAQFTALLDLLDTAEAGDGDDGLSATCILSTIDAAISGDPLPACAGGPPTPTLALTAADYADGRLTITFSEPIDAPSATNVKHYHVTPNGEITAVTMVEGVGSTVVASVALEPGSYALTASRIQAMDGSPLDPAHSSAPFTVEAPAKA